MTEQEYQALVAKLIKKENNLLLFKKEGRLAYILGTIHQHHFIESSDYSLANVQSVMETVKPDILLIEARQETLDDYGAVDGPSEMVFAKAYADEHHIPLKGIDWWRAVKDNETMFAAEFERDDRMFDNIEAASEGYNTVLALCGASHRERMPERFIMAGYEQVEINDISAYFGSITVPFQYPKGIKDDIMSKSEYFKKGFIKEVERNISPGDELYDHFFAMTVPKEPNSMLSLVEENKLYG